MVLFKFIKGVMAVHKLTHSKDAIVIRLKTSLSKLHWSCTVALTMHAQFDEAHYCHLHLQKPCNRYGQVYKNYP